jgi:hypothetical protein
MKTNGRSRGFGQGPSRAVSRLGGSSVGSGAQARSLGTPRLVRRLPGAASVGAVSGRLGAGRYRKRRLSGLQGTDGRGTRCLGVARGRGTWPGGSRGEAWHARDGAWRGRGCTAQG